MSVRHGPKTADKHSGDGDIKSDEDQNEKNKVNILGRKINKIVFVVHVNICLYAISFFVQVGSLPYLSKRLGLDPALYGYLQTTFAVIQLAGGPIFGRFGDLYGGRAALTLAFGSAAVSYALMMISVNVPMLFISRIPSLFMHAMQAGQMVVTDVSDSSQRAAALGTLGLTYGIGMVIGPFIGGLITRHLGEFVAAGVACFSSTLSALLCFIFVPGKTKILKKEKQDKRGDVFNLSTLMSALKQPKALMLLSIKAISGIPIGIFQSMFSVVAMETFKLRPDQNGYILSYVGILSMITQGVGVGFLSKRLSEMNIIKLATILMTASYLLLAYVLTVKQLCLVLIPLTIGLSLMSVVISSALTHTVPDTDTGAMLGINMAVNSLIRTLSPALGGVMLSAYGFQSIGYIGFVTNSLITVYMVTRQ